MDCLGLLLNPPALRAFYLAASALVLVIQAIPALRDRFLAYGPRATSAKPSYHSRRPNGLEKLLDYAASFQVPHNYFTHFYVVSVASSVFWAWKLQLWIAGGQLPVAWALMLLQGVRRLAESYAYTSSGKSTMWFAHWILGLLFYLATNVAVWSELQTDVASDPKHNPGVWTELQTDVASDTKYNPGALQWKTAGVLMPAVLTVQALQHIYHAYLYRLRTQHAGYQLPSHPLFPNLLCPHYTCDIAFYVLLSILGAPTGASINWTLATAALFTAVNLGVTAAGTKLWYEEKFGKHKVSGRRHMIPWVW